jgi:hypothetical protein
VKDWLAQLIGQQLQVNPFAALVVVVALTFAAQWIWGGLVKLWDRWRYGNWRIIVTGGNSGRDWHAPLDKEIVRNLIKRNYFIFKRDLGTVISGEVTLSFSFGVPVSEPLDHKPPVAPGLTIDYTTRTIAVDCVKAKHAEKGVEASKAPQSGVSVSASPE